MGDSKVCKDWLVLVKKSGRELEDGLLGRENETPGIATN